MLQAKLPAAKPKGEPLPEGLLWLLLTGEVSCLAPLHRGRLSASLRVEGQLEASGSLAVAGSVMPERPGASVADRSEFETT